MKNFKSYLGLFLFTMLVLSSCKKESISSLDNQTLDTQTEEIKLPDTNELPSIELPPINGDEINTLEDRHYVYEKESESLGWETIGFDPFQYLIEVRSEVSHGSHGGGYYKSNAEVCAALNGFSFACATNDEGNVDIWVLQKHYFWNAPLGEWRVCTGTGWVKNPGNKQEVELPINHPSNTPVCGNGWYGNMTYSYFFNPITEQYQWGPTVWSGAHHLPD